MSSRTMHWQLGDRVPLAYLITFACHGARLHGDERGAVTRRRNLFGTPLLEANAALAARQRESMRSRPYLLGERERQVVLASIVEVCVFRQWVLFAVHVRSNHVHAVIDADDPGLANTLKAYASRALNDIEGPRRRWARGFSRRLLWSDEAVERAIHYVVHEQGAPMAVHHL